MFKRMMSGIIKSRQAKANLELAITLQRYEFTRESVDQVLHRIETGTLHKGNTKNV